MTVALLFGPRNLTLNTEYTRRAQYDNEHTQQISYCYPSFKLTFIS